MKQVKAEENADTIDLALLDVVMPKLGGRAVLERIREKHPQVLDRE